MLRSFLLLAVLTLTWGFNWAVMKIGVAELPPLWFRSLALLLGTACLGLLLMARGIPIRLPRRVAIRVLWLSFPNITAWYLGVTLALTMLPAGRAAILGFTMPVWSALLGVLVFGERLEGKIVFGATCAVGAVALMIAGDWTAIAAHPSGVAVILFAAVSWAFGTHLFKRAAIDADMRTVTFWMMLFGCPILVGASAIFEGAAWRVPVGVEWLPIVYNAVLVLAIGNVIWFTLANTLPPTTAGLSSMLIPVVGVFAGMAVLHETPSWYDFAALALVCIAVGAALLSSPRGTARDHARSRGGSAPLLSPSDETSRT